MRRLLLALTVATAVLTACSARKPAGLMLAIQTDLSMTKDLDQLGIYVLANGTPILSETYMIEGGRVRLPSTIAIAPPANPPSAVRVRVVGFKGGSARIVRDAFTTVPTDRLAVLPLPLRWLDDGSAVGGDAEFQVNPFAKARAKCAEGQTSDLGVCVDANVPESKLALYEPAAIFGGGDEGAGSCFPTPACFAGGVTQPLDETTCTIAKPAAPSNVAVVTNGDGDLVGTDTVIVLDEGSEWSAVGDRLQLPKALCAAPVRARWKFVLTSAACVTKTARYPACGRYATGTPLSTK